MDCRPRPHRPGPVPCHRTGSANRCFGRRRWHDAAVGYAERPDGPDRDGTVVRSLAFAPDQSCLLMGTDDGLVGAVMWPAADQSRPLVTTDRGITALAVAADGSQAITGHEDGSLQRWCLPGWTPLGGWRGTHHKILAVGVRAADGAAILCSGSGAILLWQRDGQIKEIAPPVHQPKELPADRDPTMDEIFHGFWVVMGALTAASFTDDCGLVYRCFIGGRVDRINVFTGTVTLIGQPASLFSDGGPVALAIAPDGGTAAVGFSDGSVALKALPTWQDRWCRVAAHGLGGAVSWSPDGRDLVCADRDQGIRVFDVERGCQRQVLACQECGVAALAVDAESERLLALHHDSKLMHWDMDLGCPERVSETHLDLSAACFLARDGATGLGTAAGSPLRLVSDWPADWDENTRMEAMANWPENRLVVWNLETGDIRHTLTNLRVRDRLAALSADGTLALDTVAEGQVRTWDTITGALLYQKPATWGPLKCLAFSRCSAWVGAAAEDGRIVVWPARDPDKWVTLEANASKISVLAIAPGGHTVAVGEEAGRVSLWSLANRALLWTSAAHLGPVRWVEFSPDGRTLATAGADSTIHFWDTDSGSYRLSFAVMAAADWLALLPNGRFAGSERAARTVHRVHGAGLMTLASEPAQAVGPATLAAHLLWERRIASP